MKNQFFKMILRRILQKAQSVQLPKRLIFNHSYMQRKDVDDVLSALRDESDLKKLPFLYWLLLDPDQSIRITAANLLHEIIHNATGTNLTRIDTFCREKTSIEWAGDWTKRTPDELVPLGISDLEKTSIYGFSSFHPNGFFREKAVRLLSQSRSGIEIPYLLIRVNDWVDVIRSVSKSATINRLKPEYAFHFVRALPLVKRLEHCGREKHSNIIAQIFLLISNNREALEEGFKATDTPTRRFCFQIAVSSSFFSNSDLINILKKEPSGHVRAYDLSHLEQRLTVEDVKFMITDLFNDKFVKVGCRALDIYCRFYLSDAQDVLKRHALSAYSCMRETAVFYLKKNGFNNPSEIYRSVLGNMKEVPIGAILGIGETGTADDIGLILRFLENPKSSVVKATIRSISRLKPKDVAPIIQPFIADIRPGVSSEAFTALSKRPSIDMDLLHNYFLNSEYQHVQKNTLRLLCSQSQWNSLPYILEACSNENLQIKTIGEEFLRQWFIRSTRSFMKSTESQREKINSAISKYSFAIGEKVKRQLEFILK